MSVAVRICLQCTTRIEEKRQEKRDKGKNYVQQFFPPSSKFDFDILFIAYRTRSFVPAVIIHFVVALVVTIAATALGGAAGQIRF